MTQQREIGLIGIPLDFGAGMRGVDMGPSALRQTGLVESLGELDIRVKDFGNVLVHTRALVRDSDPEAHFHEEIMRVCDSAADMVLEALQADLMPIVMGGDHTIAMASLAAMAKHYGPGGVIWVDAHGDLNTPATSPSGNLHGMSLAVALGLCDGDTRFTNPKWPTPWVLPEHSVLIGTRDLDEGERAYLRQPGAPRVFTMADIDKRGIANVAEEAIAVVRGANFFHVTLDLDAMDPLDAPGVGTPVRGGFTYREAHTLMEMLSPERLGCIDLVEVNPILDVGNRTARLAAELAGSLMGKRIL